MPVDLTAMFIADLDAVQQTLAALQERHDRLARSHETLLEQHATILQQAASLEAELAKQQSMALERLSEIPSPDEVAALRQANELLAKERDAVSASVEELTLAHHRQVREFEQRIADLEKMPCEPSREIPLAEAGEPECGSWEERLAAIRQQAAAERAALETRIAEQRHQAAAEKTALETRIAELQQQVQQERRKAEGQQQQVRRELDPAPPELQQALARLPKHRRQWLLEKIALERAAATAREENERLKKSIETKDRKLFELHARLQREDRPLRRGES
jgi:hypothetical protein